jgi:HSP20 family protein
MSEAPTPTEPRENIVAIAQPPWEDLDGLFEQLHRELLPVFGPTVRWPGYFTATPGAATDVEDTGAAYEIHVDLPGFSKENIEVHVQGRQVQLKAVQKPETSDKKGRTYLRQERSFQSTERTFELPEPLAVDGVTAKFENGVLQVVVPKAHPAAERKVEVA